MMQAPLSICIIAKNEEFGLEACLKSIRDHVAEIIVVDTGSTDKTPDIAKRYADKFEVFTDCNDEQGQIVDFSLARTRSFELASHDWRMWIDADDIVLDAENLSPLIEKAVELDDATPTCFLFRYEYTRDDDHNVTCSLIRERIFRPWDLFEWRRHVHEVVIPKDPAVRRREIFSESVTIVHNRDFNKKPIDPLRNLRILEAQYRRLGETDIRQLFYLAMEYCNINDFANAIKFFKRYIELSDWRDERYLAELKLSEIYELRREHDYASEWANKALDTDPSRYEALFSLARITFNTAINSGNPKRNWEKSLEYAMRGLSLPTSVSALAINPTDRTIDIQRVIGSALYNLGRYGEALHHIEPALSRSPNDVELNMIRQRCISDIAKQHSQFDSRR